MTIKEEVEHIIQKRWKGLKDPEELISQHTIEKQTNEGYNGRQLLELFQNCEDEGANSVVIHLNTTENKLAISNDGLKPFSVKGYTSLFYPGLSSKVSSGFIGNKGLGFRSIINWAQKVRIKSNNFELVFAKELQRETLINKIGYSDLELNELREQRKLKPDVYPIPFLNSCEINELLTPNKYTTTIEVTYKKEFEQDIIKQINSISEKTLLFLNHINHIQITGDKIQKDISVNRTPINKYTTEVLFKGNTLTVISDEGVVDYELTNDSDNSEPKKYSVKIAFNDKLTYSDNVLYNFFKTKIPFNFPFVAHASIELDQNRNHITESSVNPFILQKLLDLHIKLVEKLKTNTTKSWLPYSAIDKDTENIYEPYSLLIEKVWYSLVIYPTISGNYENYQAAKSLRNPVAKFLESFSLQRSFPNQIVPIERNLNPFKYIKKPKDYPEVIESIGTNLGIDQRAIFIKIILQEFKDERFSILVDEEGNTIEKGDYVYTNKTSDNKSLRVPSYSSIRFIQNDLYKKLIIELSLQNELNKSRALKEKLEKMSDVHSFEPMTVIRKLISETLGVLKVENDDARKLEIITEFYQTLFHNYQLREENPSLDYLGVVPCLNKSGEIVDIKSLVLSNQFDDIKKAYEKFGPLYDEKRELINLSYLGLESENNSEVQSFLLWLGINQHFILNKELNKLDSSYKNRIKGNYTRSPISGELFWIEDLDAILRKDKLDISHVIALLYVDKNINDLFSNFTVKYSSKENLKYNYYGIKSYSNYENRIYSKIVTFYNIENYLITSKRSEWFNPFTVDYEFLLGFNQNLDRNEANRILAFLGGKVDFNELSIDYLKLKCEELAQRNNTKGAQVFYKNLVGHYKTNELPLSNCNLYAKVADQIKVVEAKNVYFSDRIQLPQSLTNKFPIFYYPSRSGGTAAIKMFGIRDLNLLDLKIQSAPINESIKQSFETYLKEIKPFILAFRLDKITLENVKKNQVQLLNKLKLVCCLELHCTIEGELFQVEAYNYVYDNETDQFFVHIPRDNKISDLRQNKVFIDNLSDLFLKVFDTHDEKKTFVSVLRQSHEDNLFDVNNELAEGILEEAIVMLGEISVRLSIWCGIFNLKQMEYEVLNEHNLDEHIQDAFPEASEYNTFYSTQSLDDLKAIRGVFAQLQINLTDYNAVSDFKLSFDSLFQAELLAFYDLKKKTLKNQVWRNRSISSIEAQIGFLNDIYQVENLLTNYKLTEKLDQYDFSKIILDELSLAFKNISFNLEVSNFKAYDHVEGVNFKLFTADEILKIRRDSTLNSLLYFEGTFDYIKSEISENKELDQGDPIQERQEDIILEERTPEKVDGFEIVVPKKAKKPKPKPWMGNQKDELSPQEKKKLGNNAENIVKEYLEKHPETYSNVEHISKTDEGAHYDLKYLDLQQNIIKYVECKYFNGYAFFVSREEKNFAEKKRNQYEIWLVNKYKQIYCISNFKELGDLEPNNYKVHIKITDYDIQN